MKMSGLASSVPASYMTDVYQTRGMVPEALRDVFYLYSHITVNLTSTAINVYKEKSTAT